MNPVRRMKLSKSQKTKKTVDDEDEEAKEKEAREAKLLLDTRRAINMLLDAVRSLKRANKSLLELQSDGRHHAVKESKESSAALAEHKHRAFMLLAEFLDAGALTFHEALEVSMKDTNGANHDECILFAAERGLSFVLKSSPEVAVPLDPKAQTLRAALAVDGAAVREMLESQLFRRMESSLTLVLLNAAKAGPGKMVTGLGVVGEEEKAALRKTQDRLLEAVNCLEERLTLAKPAWH